MAGHLAKVRRQLVYLCGGVWLWHDWRRRSFPAFVPRAHPDTKAVIWECFSSWAVDFSSGYFIRYQALIRYLLRMEWKSPCKTHGIIFANLSYILFPVQCLHGIGILSCSIALPPADEKKFLGVGGFLGILRGSHSATRCGFSHPYDYLNVART